MLKISRFAVLLSSSLMLVATHAFAHKDTWKVAYCHDALTYRTPAQSFSKSFAKKMNTTDASQKISGIAVIPFDQVTRPRFALIEFLKNNLSRNPFGLNILSANTYHPKGKESGIGFLLIQFESTKSQVAAAANMQPMLRHRSGTLGPYVFAIESFETGSVKSVQTKLAKRFADTIEEDSESVDLADGSSEVDSGMSQRPGRGERAGRESPKRYGQPPIDGSTGGTRDWDRYDDTYVEDSIDVVRETSGRNSGF